MTHDDPAPLRPGCSTPRAAELRESLATVFEKIAGGALQRELDGELPFEPVQLLKDAGFGAVRVPEVYGGRGASVQELAQLWILLGEADANLPQVFRGHFALVEDRLLQHSLGIDQSRWFERFVAGEIVGNAWSEVGATAIDTQHTTLRRDGDGYSITGTKYYTTGTIFAEWVDVYARLDGEGDEFAVAIVDTRQPGVVVSDDWDGFGQRGTGSGTTTFDGAIVPSDHVLPFAERFPYQSAFFQLNLLATLVGIGRAALRDTVTEVQGRTRNFSHANAARVRDDAQVLARVGEMAAAVSASEATTLRVATALQDAFEGVRSGVAEQADLIEAAEVAAAAGQVVVTELVLRATSDLFDTLGASAAARPKALDRHWRNARTVSSHNPRILKARVVGGHVVNGTPPPYSWSIGRTRRDQDAEVVVR